jgi:succinyl-diaminopimelate desuccinylase
MEFDFYNEVLKRKDALIKDLTDLLKINSELTVFDPKNVNAPFGEGIRESLDFMEKLAERDGFSTLNVDNYCLEINHGTTDDYVLAVGHLDVVPAGSGWNHPPYSAFTDSVNIYGRGAEDDKGPTIEAYYALKIIKDLKLPLSKKIRLLCACDEESGMRDVDYYLKKCPKLPDAGIVPDAEFPLIYGEKGIAAVKIEIPNMEGLKNATGGLRLNMVPEKCILTLDSKKLDNKFISEKKIDGTYTFCENDSLVKLNFNGISAHGSTPELGKNAIIEGFKFLSDMGFKTNLVDFICRYFSDYELKAFGASKTHPEMGNVSNNLGIIKLVDDTIELYLNVRYPIGTSGKQIVKQMNTSIKQYNAKAYLLDDTGYLFIDKESPLIKTCMNAYQEYSKDYETKPFCIGGGTFARKFPNSVAFGAHFPSSPSANIHNKDEYVIIEDVLKATAIYAKALYELAK